MKNMQKKRQLNKPIRNEDFKAIDEIKIKESKVMSFEDRLKEKLSKVAEEKQEIVVVSDTNEIAKSFFNAYNQENLDYIDEFSLTELEKEELKAKTRELFTLDATNKIFLGKVFSDIFDLIGNQKDGVYQEWIAKTKINQRTALRYRNRYQLYKLIETDEGKKTVMDLSQEDIETTLKEEDVTKKVVNILDNGGDKTTVKDFLKQLIAIEYKEDEENKSKEFDSHTIQSMPNYIQTNITNNWETLEKSKQKKISKLFVKIKEIFEGN